VFDAQVLQAEAEAAAERLEMLRNLRVVGMDDGPVPDFVVRTTNGTEFNSTELVGQQPFVVAFFATWCKPCGRKLQSLRHALSESGPMLVIPVSVDGPETIDEVEAYLGAKGLDGPAVVASDYPAFAFSYDPFDTVPLLVIVGRNGGLVDYQLGEESEQDQRLVASLRLAQVIAPLAEPSEHSRRDGPLGEPRL
jgi:hypothetical protein